MADDVMFVPAARRLQESRMSPDEAIALMISLGIAVVAWARWLFVAITRAPLGAGFGIRVALALTPILCGVLLFSVLKLFAASDVRNDLRYLAMYQIMGAAWVGLGQVLIASMGISMRDDALERRNAGASTILCAALLALTLCFAGGNIGDGPGWWVVIFSAVLSTAALFGLWWTVQHATALADVITIERNLSDALRFSGFLLAIGLILGRSVAGTWVNAAETVKDFLVMGWPALALALVEIGAGAIRNNDRVATLRGSPITGLGIGVFYIAAAIGYVIFLGWWS
jgi:hypothetical protein